ncbi:hypothetical protein [Streptomyces sp. NPDC092307]
MAKFAMRDRERLGLLRVSATVLGVLAAEGRICRSRPAGSWTSAQFC